MKSLGSYLRELREKKGVPIREVASSLSLDQSTWSKFERDDRTPKKELIEPIADYFSLDLEELSRRVHVENITKSLNDSEDSEQVLILVHKRLSYIKSKQYVQTKMEL